MIRKNLIALILTLICASCGTEYIAAGAMIYTVRECHDNGGTWEFGECQMPEEGDTDNGDTDTN